VAWRVRNFYHDKALPGQRENSYGHIPRVFEQKFPDDGPAMRWEAQQFTDFARLVKGDGALPLLVPEVSLMTERNMMDPMIRAHVYIEYLGWTYPQLTDVWGRLGRRMGEVAGREGALFAELSQRVPHDLEHIKDHVHITAKGCAKVAEGIADRLGADPAAVAILSRREPAKTASLN
jgi:hypothetical protein